MAKKVHKKPRHTSLVVPGDDKRKKKKAQAQVPEKEKDRMGRVTPGETVYRMGMGETPGATPADMTPESPVQEDAKTVSQSQAQAARAGVFPPDEVEPGDVELFGMGTPVPGSGRGERASGGREPAGGEASGNTPGGKKPGGVARGFFRKKSSLGADTASGKSDVPAGQNTTEPLPANAIVLPRKNPRVAAVRRKKRWRRIRVLVVVLLLACGLLVYFSGLYVAVSMKAGEAFESMRIHLQPGDGFPMDFAMNGFIKAESMGENGFAALGSADMAIVSSTGKELRRVQHGYVAPAMTAGNTRVCVYTRGGKEYVVEGREKRIAYRTTEQEILFAEMSPGGNLALFTHSSLQVYDTQYEQGSPSFKMSLTDEEPIAATFYTDDRSLALGCLSAREGALGSTLYLLRTDRKDVQAKIRVNDAVVLQLHFTKDGQILAVFDTFAALYGKDGSELARYDYDGRQLRTADYYAGKTALCFGSVAQEKVELVLLDEALTPLFSASSQGTGTPRALVGAEGAYLLVGQEVRAYTLAGTLVETQVLDAKAYSLVWGGQPLAITATAVLPLADMLQPADSSAVG